jgi:SAM-dependent methyltransferase
MSDPQRSVPGEAFDAKYLQDDDPWGFASSPYELEKYRTSLAALPRDTYRNGLEIGCSIGVFTAMLASRCERLLAVDISEVAVQRARKRCRQLPHVLIETCNVPAAFPDDEFDLIVLSEVGYYWASFDLIRARAEIIRHLAPGGHLLLVHWTLPIDDAPLTGDDVHDLFVTSAELDRVGCRREPTYRLDVLEKRQVARLSS